MCSICGELRFGDPSPAVLAVERRSEQLPRRWPDHANTTADGPLAVARRRPAIIDLSPRADQPLGDTALQLALVLNSTICCYREMRTVLAAMGYVFFAEGASEVSLKACQVWCEPCVQRCHGMFALAIWHTRVGHSASLVTARERFGFKPLYLAQDAPW